MSFYKELLVLEPYFKSIRKLKDYLSFDLEIPKTWKLPKKFVKEEQIVEFENNSVEMRSISFVAKMVESEITNLIFNIKNVIDFNRELEEKEKLLCYIILMIHICNFIIENKLIQIYVQIFYM